MTIITKMFAKKKLEIQYRWKVEGAFTGWTTYKKFKTKIKFEEELSKLSHKSSEFVQYKVA